MKDRNDKVNDKKLFSWKKINKIENDKLTKKKMYTLPASGIKQYIATNSKDIKRLIKEHYE